MEDKQNQNPVPAAASKAKLNSRSLFGDDDDFDDLEDLEEAKPDDEMIQLPDEQDPAGLMILSNDLMGKAIEMRCSDMHVEPEAAMVVVRYLSNKELVKQSKLPKAAHAELVFCYKVIAGLNISEGTKPQDKKATIQICGEDIEIRVTTIPGELGETVAISFKYSGTPA